MIETVTREPVLRDYLWGGIWSYIRRGIMYLNKYVVMLAIFLSKLVLKCTYRIYGESNYIVVIHCISKLTLFPTNITINTLISTSSVDRQ